MLTVVAPDDDNAVWINQDAWFSLANLEAGIEKKYEIKRKENGVYVFVISGDVTVNGQQLNTRDGLGITETTTLDIKADTASEILLIDVPMTVKEA